jgi:hypothetical protein
MMLGFAGGCPAFPEEDSDEAGHGDAGAEGEAGKAANVDGDDAAGGRRAGGEDLPDAGAHSGSGGQSAAAGRAGDPSQAGDPGKDPGEHELGDRDGGQGSDAAVIYDELCGNGVLDDGEECDAEAHLPCSELGFGTSPAQHAACEGCVWQADACTCGNDAIDPGEHCDGDRIEATCQSVIPADDESWTGTLRCDVHCEHDISDCVPIIEGRGGAGGTP